MHVHVQTYLLNNKYKHTHKKGSIRQCTLFLNEENREGGIDRRGLTVDVFTSASASSSSSPSVGVKTLG